MEDYSAKLTAEPFLYNETKTIAKFLLDGEDEEKLRKRNVEENLIKYKSQKSIVRVNSPIFRLAGNSLKILKPRYRGRHNIRKRSFKNV